MHLALTPEQESLKLELEEYFARLVTPEVKAALSASSGEFGDTEAWDVPRTITNAVLRDGGASPVRIQVDDIEVVETESRTQAAVALLVDTSFSMAMDGR